jgi:hypothetical protein
MMNDAPARRTLQRRPQTSTVMRYRFVEDGRYLVNCNPVDSINAWVFGVVNVVTQR